MALFDQAGAGAKQGTASSTEQNQGLSIGLKIGIFAFVCLLIIVGLAVTGAIETNTTVELIGALIGLVIVFAVLQLFAIADTLKEILAELQRRN